ncbi:MAG: GEVED domain-containing protein, partial [Salegentibacter sp.]
ATLGTAEQITITVRNFGSNAQSNFPVSYTINGETVTETFSDNLPAVTSVNYTFSETADLSNIGETYTVTATTALDIDEKPSNDEFSGEVRNLPAKDVGVVAIASPSTGQNLSANEQVSVTIGNFGGQPQQDIPVSYRIGVRNPVEEVFPGPLPVGEEKLFTFSQTVDLSNPARYRIVAETDLKDDFDPSNDKQERSVAHLNCIPEGSDCSFGDGIYYFQLGESSNERIPCGNGYEDFIGSRDTYSLDRSQDSFTVTVQSYYTLTTDGDEKFSLWIDLNDNAVFEDSEMVISSEVIPTADESYSYDFSLPANADLGQHLMRVRAGDTSYEGDLNDPCSVMEYGTTHDYSVNISDSTLSIDDFLSEDAKLLIVSEDYKHFQVVLETSLDAPLRITVHDILGQKLLDNEIESDGEAYVYPLDMSYAARGVYLVRVGTRKAGKVKRIIVK